MGTSTYKTSTILVSTGTKKKTRVFRSMEEIPANLRDKLHANISGPNSRTLIVADRRGREYLIRTLKRATRRASAERIASRACGKELCREGSLGRTETILARDRPDRAARGGELDPSSLVVNKL